MLLFLYLYMVLLVIAAWPVTATHKILVRAERISSALLSQLSILPGLKLFYRPYAELQKPNGECIVIKGYRAAGPSTLIAVVPRDCNNGRGFQWFADPREVAVHRLLEEAALERVADFDRFGARTFSADNPGTAHELAVYESLGDFYCQSSLVPRPPNVDFSFVAIGWTQKKIDYHTAEKTNVLTLLARWDCARRTIESVEWEPFIPALHKEAFLNDRSW